MKIVLAYSGGLDTSVIVKWLKETYRRRDRHVLRRHRSGGGTEGRPRKGPPTGASKRYYARSRRGIRRATSSTR